MPRHNPKFTRRKDEKTGGWYDDLAGQRFGAWTVISRSYAKWLCRCDCGTERLVYAFTLVNGSSLSCGCRPRAPRLKLEEPSITAIIYRGSKFYAVLPTDACTTPRAMFQDLSEAREYRDHGLPRIEAIDALIREAAADDSPMLRMSDPGAMDQLREALGLPSSVTPDDAERHTENTVESSTCEDTPQTS